MADRTSRFLLYCACCMLAATVALSAISIVFHPRKSVTATHILELTRKLECVKCSVGILENKSVCQKCYVSSTRQNVPFNDCELTEHKKFALEQVVKQKVKRDTLLKEISNEPQRSFETKNKSSTSAAIKKLEYLSLNVPRPSAHWLLKHKYAKPKTGNDSKNISLDFYDSIANSSFVGINNKNGQMKFDIPGWYQIYFQIHIHSNTPEEKRYIAQARIENRKNKYESKYLIQSEETVKCELKHHKRHPSKKIRSRKIQSHACVSLRGTVVHQIIAGDVLRIEAEIPNDAYLDTRMGRSFLGASYIHKPSVFK